MWTGCFGEERRARGKRHDCTRSGTLPEYGIHALRHGNDGIYGNGHSWISDTKGSGWAELELAAPVRINRVVWSRDREGKFIDRLATEYRVEVAMEPGARQLVSSSRKRCTGPTQRSGTLSSTAISEPVNSRYGSS